MTAPSPIERPALKAGCRLSPASSPESLLLIPEGVLRLQGPSRRILELCDGRRNLGEVIEVLCREYPAAEAGRIADEVTSLLERLQDRGAVEFL